MSLKEGLDPCRLDEAGWAIVFAEGADPAIREALMPLIRHRQCQAGGLRAERCRELEGRDGYRYGESRMRFMARHRAGPGPADPDRMPYYVLLVGDPEEIPYTVQYQLDLQYAVGRVCFDTPEEYARYAESVVAAERGEFRRPKRVSFFGVRNSDDVATQRCHDLLVMPVANELDKDLYGWEVTAVCGPEATKERLGRLLGGDETPALLFAASHGLSYRGPHVDQRRLQGALVCQKRIDRSFDQASPFFAADDIADHACPGGLVAFFFACFSAGTPRLSDFAHMGDPTELAKRAFVARLPQRLLSHPRGGALAVVGRVDRTWTYSFDWPLAGPQREVFSSTVKRLVAGHPLGSAMEYFNQRYAELECELADLRSTQSLGASPDFLQETSLWTARNDARNVLVVGDPAVRLTPCSDSRGSETV